MINDRGHKKWVSLKLPQHRVLLQEMWEARNDISSSELDEDQFAELQHEIEQAISQSRNIRITFYRNRKLEEIEGYIKKYDGLTKTLFVILEDKSTFPIQIHNIKSSSLI